MGNWPICLREQPERCISKAIDDFPTAKWECLFSRAMELHLARMAALHAPDPVPASQKDLFAARDGRNDFRPGRHD